MNSSPFKGELITHLANQLYDLADYADDGEHNLKAAIATGSFDVVTLLDALASALPAIIALIKALIDQPELTPKT